jgi:hypothetical protein
MKNAFSKIVRYLLPIQNYMKRVNLKNHWTLMLKLVSWVGAMCMCTVARPVEGNTCQPQGKDAITTAVLRETERNGERRI